MMKEFIIGAIFTTAIIIIIQILELYRERQKTKKLKEQLEQENRELKERLEQENRELKERLEQEVQELTRLLDEFRNLSNIVNECNYEEVLKWNKLVTTKIYGYFECIITRKPSEKSREELVSVLQQCEEWMKNE